MIQNLNQINFQMFGNIVPSRENTSNSGEITQSFVVNPEEESVCVYRTLGPMQMQISSGKSVLSHSVKCLDK